MFLLLCAFLVLPSILGSIVGKPEIPGDHTVSLFVPFFTLTDATGAATTRVAPNDNIGTGKMGTGCEIAIVVRNVDLPYNIDVNLGTFPLATDLATKLPASIVCNSSDNFPNPFVGQTITVMQHGSSTPLLTYPVGNDDFPLFLVKELRISAEQPPVNPGTPSVPKVGQPDAVFLTIADYKFTLVDPILSSPSVEYSLVLSCEEFTIPNPIECTVLSTNNGSYPAVNSTLFFTAKYTLFQRNGQVSEVKTVEYPPGASFQYVGFLEDVPDSMTNNQLIGLSGHFPVDNAAPTDYSCVFQCVAPQETLTKATPGIKLTSRYLTCMSIDFADPDGTGTGGIPDDTKCTFSLNYKQTLLPTSTADNVFYYQVDAMAHPQSIMMHTTTGYVRPGEEISVQLGTSCDALLFKNDYGEGSSLSITFNGTIWVDGLVNNFTSQLRCLSVQPSATSQIPLKIINVETGGKLTTIWDEAVPASVWHSATDPDGMGSWNMISVSKYKGSTTLVGQEYPIVDFTCGVTTGPSIAPWNLDCDRTQDRTLGDVIKCATAAKADPLSDPYPPVSAYGISFLHLTCSMLWPGQGINPYPPQQGARVDVTFNQDELPYIGFVTAPSTPPKLFGGQLLVLEGVFSDNNGDFDYSCVYSGPGLNNNQPYAMTDNNNMLPTQLSCLTPPAGMFSTFPMTASVTFYQTNVRTRRNFGVPATGPISVTFIDQMGPAPSNEPSSSQPPSPSFQPMPSPSGGNTPSTATPTHFVVNSAIKTSYFHVTLVLAVLLSTLLQ